MDISSVKGIGFFGLLTDNELKLILATARERKLAKDEQIIRQGQQHAALFLVADGMLHVHRRAERSDVFLGRIEKGSFFGEIGLFDPGPATATIRAMSNTTLFEISRENFETLIDQQPALGCKILKAMMNEMARRLRRVDQRLVDSFFWGEATQSK